ncbi:hypothetical protein QN395_05450, partial [Undibacterium sp. RTI2.2]|uniref:hypothetical protein n=1 Tax=Undibacterium sp. RTI2.2 TaxID=3048638 RepID=UPI002B233A88
MKKLFNFLVICMSLTSPVKAAEMPEGWEPFVWEDFTSSGYVFSHAAINLPAKLNNIDCYVQLDTGANYAFGLTREFKLGGKLVTVSLQVGSIYRNVTIPEDAIKKINSLESCGRIGLVGNAFFERGTIYINLQLAMFKFEHGSSLLNDSTSENFVYARKPG